MSSRAIFKVPLLFQQLFQPPALPPAVAPFDTGFGFFQPLSTAVKIGVSLAIIATSGQPFVAKAATRDNTVTPDSWMMRWDNPPKYSPPRDISAPFFPWAQQVSAPSSFFSVSTSQIVSRTLFYQAKVEPPYFNASIFQTNTVTPDNWLIRWQGPPRIVPPSILAQPFIPKAATSDNTVTPDSWLSRWHGPPAYTAAKTLAQPFIPQPLVPTASIPFFNVTTSQILNKTLYYQARVEPPYFTASQTVVIPNTIKGIPWFQHWKIADKARERIHARQFYAIPGTPPLFTFSINTSYVGVTNLYYQSCTQVFPTPPFVSNTVTLDKWQAFWIPPPLYKQTLQPGLPFVPKAATIDNTVTPDRWLRPLNAPPRYLQGLPGGQPFVPAVSTQPASQTVTPDNWLRPLDTPPRYLQGLPGGQPFVPKAATVDNTVTPDAWLARWEKAAPVPPPVQTEPIYPWEVALFLSNTVTPDKWLLPLAAPPRYLQTLQPGSPFIPTAATSANTVAWQQFTFTQAAKVPSPVVTNPLFPWQSTTISNTVTPDAWLIRWDFYPARLPNYTIPSPPFIPPAAVVFNTVTPDKWLSRWDRPPLYKLPLGIGGLPFIPAAATSANTFQWDRVQARFEKAVPIPQSRLTQPVFGFPYTGGILNTPTGVPWWNNLSTSAVQNRIVVGALVAPSEFIILPPIIPTPPPPPPPPPRAKKMLTQVVGSKGHMDISGSKGSTQVVSNKARTDVQDP